MKKNKYILNWCLGIICGVLLTSCENTDYMTYDSSFTGIYFSEDSVKYSFGITSLDVDSYVMKLPIKIMGAPTKERRSFKIEIVADSSTALEKKHYKLPAECFIEGDSVNGVLDLEIFRAELGDARTWKLMIKLLKNDNFNPIKGVGVQTMAMFSNIVEPPAWKNWQGKPTWISSQLGPWNPVVWVKFMEYFRKMENTKPVTYQAIVKVYGPNLEDANGWLWDYNDTLTKYVLVPLYAFFQEHPEYDVEMPNPNK